MGVFGLALNGGDPVAGELLFRTGQTARCLQCHRVGKGDGADVGPNLAGLAMRRDRAYILRAVVKPSVDIDEKYKSHLFELASGDNVTGSIVRDTGKTLVVAQADGEEVTIDKADIDEQRSSKLSIMPDMTKALSPKDFRNLVAYLSSLK